MPIARRVRVQIPVGRDHGDADKVNAAVCFVAAAVVKIGSGTALLCAQSQGENLGLYRQDENNPCST